VHNLPGFVYFDHSAHINKGVGCASCHGQVNEMPLTWQHGSLLMEWCLECHRDPAQHLRPRDQVYNMTWEPADQRALGTQLVKEYHVRLEGPAGVNPLTNCSTCHR
jgi:hypothetical protein